MLQHKDTGEFVSIVLFDATDEVVYYQTESDNNLKKMCKWDFIELYQKIPTCH